MQSRWYRLPEDEQQDDGPAIRGGKAQGRRGRGRGNGRQAQESHCMRQGAATPHHMHGMGQFPMHPYYYNPPGMEEMPPHWQYIASHASHKDLNQAQIANMSGYQRFPINNAGQPGHHQYYNKAQEHFPHFVNMGGTHPAHATRANQNHRGGYVQSPGFNNIAFQHPAYAHYENQTNRGHRQLVDIRAGQKGQRTETARASAVHIEDSKKLEFSRPVKHSNQQTPEIHEGASMCTKLPVDPPNAHHLRLPPESPRREAAPRTVKPPQAHKTLAETAAFLDRPQLGFENVKHLSPSYPTNAKCTDFSQTLELQKEAGVSAVTTAQPPRAHQRKAPLTYQDNSVTFSTHLMPSHGEIQDLSSNRQEKVAHESKATSAQISNCRKYTELSVTLPMEPPPAHQNMKQIEISPKYPDMYTPPLAHQAPVAQIPERPQSARILATQSPIQDINRNTTHYGHSSQIDELQSICRQETKKQMPTQAIQLPNLEIHPIKQLDNLKKSKVASVSPSRDKQHKSNNKLAGCVPSSPLAVCQPQHMIGEQIVYQPSTDTFASEQLMYQPQTDMFTKEQIVYQPGKKRLAKTKVIYQPRTDFLATAEAVYQSDIVAARQMVIQPQAGIVNTAEAVYNTKESKSKRQRNSKADNMLTTTEALNQQHQIELLAARQSSYQTLTDKEACIQHANKAQTETYMRSHQSMYQAHSSHYGDERVDDITNVKAAPILHNILSNEEEEDKSQKSKNSILTLQQYLQEQQNTSVTVVPHPTLRQTRKRKIQPPSQPDWLTTLQQTAAIQTINEMIAQNESVANIANILARGSSRELVPAGLPMTETATTNMQSLMAINWLLQHMRTQQQVILPHLIALLEKSLKK